MTDIDFYSKNVKRQGLELSTLSWNPITPNVVFLQPPTKSILAIQPQMLLASWWPFIAKLHHLKTLLSCHLLPSKCMRKLYNVHYATHGDLRIAFLDFGGWGMRIMSFSMSPKSKKDDWSKNLLCSERHSAGCSCFHRIADHLMKLPQILKLSTDIDANTL